MATTNGDAGIMAYDGNGANLFLDHVVVSNNSGGQCCAGAYTRASAFFSHVTVAHNHSATLRLLKCLGIPIE